MAYCSIKYEKNKKTKKNIHVAIIMHHPPRKSFLGLTLLLLAVHVGIVTVPVQDGWTDGRTDNRPVPSLGYWSPQHAVPSPDGSEDGRPVHRKTEGRTDDLIIISGCN
ncbi:hypothetical protein C8J57DRAFT_1239343 [Mycena rebaudengoi]|nr:hypothetical protein C8J57DRAFT_1239343 [Mycena rebaudengoi]